MSTTSKEPGENFERVSKRLFGDASGAQALKRANPNPVGIINVPSLGNSIDRPASGTPEQFDLVIEGALLSNWTEIRFNQALDGIDTVAFSVPFLGRESIIKPFRFDEVQLLIGGQIKFTGTLIGVDPVLSGTQKSLRVSCYAKAGVLQDCTLPQSALAAEYNGATLSDIAADVCEPFGLSSVFEAEAGTVFERVACEPTQSPMDFLAGLAKQRGLVIRSSVEGGLIFTKSATGGAPIAVLNQGDNTFTEMTPSFNAQQYFSDISGIRTAETGTEGSTFTVKNARLSGAIRPHTFSASDVEDTDLQTAVNAKAGRMFGNMAAYSMLLPGILTPSGQVWEVNQTVNVSAEDAMIYKSYPLLIRGVELIVTESEKTTRLDLCFEGAFSGQVPESLPWD